MRQDSEMSALKRTVKELLEKHHEEIRALHITVYGGYPHHATYATRDKDNKHFTRHKVMLKQTEGRIELLEVVNT